MNYIWNNIEKQNWSMTLKYRMSIILTSLTFGICGFLAWAILQFWCLKGFCWCVIFTGYPVVASWIILFLYSCSHEFHDHRNQTAEA